MNYLPVRHSRRFPIAHFMAMKCRRWMLFALAAFSVLPVLRAVDSEQDALPNFDKRLEARAAKTMLTADPKAVARMRAQVPDVQCDVDAITGSPALITARRGFLSGADGKGRSIPAAALAKVPASDRHRAVKAFITEHNALFGHGAEALDEALLERDYVTEHSGMREIVWQQQLDGIPVFESKFQAHLTARGELINIASKFVAKPAEAAGGLGSRKAKQAAPPVSAQQAVARAAESLGETLAVEAVVPAAGARVEPGRQTFRAPRYSSISTQLVWLPMDRTSMRLCWEVLIDSKTIDGLYRVIIDAESGEAHLRQTLTEHISPVTYRIFTGDSPTPFSPGHATPSSAQPPSVQRSLVTISALNTTASPNGWIDDGGNETIGNNVDAYTALDTDPLNGPDLPRTHGSSYRVFDFPLDLTQAPVTYKEAAVVQAFYWCNFMHDKLYELGFTEGAGNFQEDNFGRGGRAGDPAFLFVQDGSSFNNANARVFGGGVTIHMYLWNGSDPDRDGALDVGILLHEYTHGLSNRLVGGGVGIDRLQTRGMGEGWSDFYALALLSKADDDLSANYPVGSYATYRLSKFTGNYYSGIRRYPYSTNMAANPLTYKDIDPAQADLHIEVPRSPIVGYVADEVHAMGEVWCAALWEARANLIAKHGFGTGNQLVLQLVTDGMKLSPANPTFIQARDAILMADLVKTGGANAGPLWAAFAKRGLGAHATSPDSLTASGVLESFDLPDEISVSPATGFTSRGRAGGSFDGTAAEFTLTNTASSPLAWTASASVPWLKVSSTTGSLPVGGSVAVTASLEAADILPRGVYSGKIIFTNGASGRIQTRVVSLTVGASDYFAEVFDTSVNDTAYQSFTFTPDESDNFYSVRRQPAAAFPTDISGSAPLALGDDSFAEVTLAAGKTVKLYETSYPAFFIGSNGYVTFGSGDDTARAPLYAHFAKPRISALFRDLNPSFGAPFGGTISWKQLSDRVAVTWSNVPEFGDTPNSNNFQIEMFFDGRIRITLLQISSTRGVIGLSRGGGIPAGFRESDFSAYSSDPGLKLTLPSTVNEGAGILANAATVSIDVPPPSDLVVTLASGDPGKVRVPASITIPAGQLSAKFSLTVEDDAILDGMRFVTITATAAGYGTVESTLAIADNETASISINVPESAWEGAGVFEGTVQLSAPPSEAVTVSLTASHPHAIQLPSVVIVPRGQTSAHFSFTVPNNNQIDGSQFVTLSATVANWSAGSATIAVFDDETNVLTLDIPAQRREGDGSLTGIARISGTLPADLLVMLASGDPTAVSVPPTVTIPAGFSFATFNVTTIDDTETDGTQSATITASATGFPNATAPVFVSDNDVARLSFSPIPGSQIRGSSFNVQIAALDINGETIPSYAGVIALSASGDGGNVAVTPATVSGFINGIWSGNVTVTDFATNVRLRVTDDLGHSYTSNPFDVTLGTLHHFEFDTVVSPHFADDPFAVTIRARDAGNNAVPQFSGSVALGALVPVSPVGVGTRVPIPPVQSGAFTNGVWTGQVSVPFAKVGIKLIASDSVGHTGVSNVFDVRPPAIGSAASVPFSEGFESGVLGAFWSVTGTNTFRTQITTGNQPRSGQRHLTMDDSVFDGLSSRNEATLTVNLAGASNVVLQFWADISSFSLGNAPPNPFLGGADFNGVAISADGNAWYEVQPLRTRNFSSSLFTVDLDAAVVAAGLSYHSNFKIRFNQYGRFSLPSEGIAIDDITITASGSRLEVSLPSRANEGAGAITGTVRIPVPLGAALVVALATSAPAKVSVVPTVTIPAGRTSVTFAMNVADNGVLDGTRDVLIMASAPGISSGIGTMSVVDNESSTFSITLPSSARESDGSVQGILTIGSPAAGAVSIPLISSDPSVLTVPMAVNVSPGQTSVAFNASIVNDSFFGNKVATITAALPNWTGTGATISIVDDEVKDLDLSVPAQVREGDGSVAGFIFLSGIPVADMVVTLTSSNTTAFTVPATITIPRGEQFVLFTFDVTDDSLLDGQQQATITASATGFSSATQAITVADNEVNRFTIEEIPASQIRGVPFSVKVTALDITDAPISNYNAPLPVTAGTLPNGAVPVSPATLADFVNGVWNGEITVLSFANNIALTIGDGLGHSIASNAFNVGTGPLHHFGISPVASPQSLAAPIPVTITAQDEGGNTVAGFNGVTSITAGTFVRSASVGAGTVELEFPMNTSSAIERTQVIYPASELGGAKAINSLSLDITETPGQTLRNWTIRIKHTSLIGTDSWEDAEWTTVYRNREAITAPGWTEFIFTTPFSYNGTDNLMIDFSFHNDQDGGNQGRSRTSISPANSTIYYRTIGYGDPLLWSGEEDPEPERTNEFPNIRLTTLRSLPVSPAITGNFINGIWTGTITTTQPSTEMKLIVTDGAGHRGISDAFAVEDRTAPSLAVTTPSTPAYTSRANVTVRGIASDASGIQSVTVNGTGAQTVDSFAHWSANVALIPGVNSVIVSATNRTSPARTASARLDVSRVADTDHDGLPDEWERQHGTDPADDGSSLSFNGPLGDANANGISNLLEYALAVDGAPVGEMRLPKLSIETNPANGKNYAVFSYRRRLGALDLDYRAETSPNLVDWISATTEFEEIAPTILNADGLTETVKIRVTPALGLFGADRKAIRLRVTAE